MNKVYNKADKIAPDGRVSALCFRKPHAICLARALWTLRWEAVTCKRCLALRSEDPDAQ